MATVGNAYVVELDAFMTILNVAGEALTWISAWRQVARRRPTLGAHVHRPQPAGPAASKFGAAVG